jgi:hypothetical protein
MSTVLPRTRDSGRATPYHRTMNAPVRMNFVKRYSNAKGDHAEAPRYTSALRMRRDSKRALVRARRRYGKLLCAA